MTKQPVFHAWADYKVAANGVVDADREAPLSGSFPGPDARGFFWSGYRTGSARAPRFPGGEPSADLLAANIILFALEQDASIIARQTLEVRLWNPGVQFTKVETPEVSGYFAAPAGAAKLPVIITLHGSEGGSFEAAKRDAGLFASHGYATLSLIYFAWEYVKVNNVPVAFDNLPLERIDAVRRWLKSRPEADTDRLGIRGISKGSEFGLLAAADYPWVKALAACVPSSLVWGAFGINTADNKPHSGFTRAGKPLAKVGYGDYAPVEQGKITLAERHRLDRAAAGEPAVSAAMIPIEHSKARFLLSGGGQDAVWPSSEMVVELQARLRAAGSAEPEIQLFPAAGHYMCGTGASPVRPASGDASDGGGSAAATAQAAGAVWDRTLQFFKSALYLSQPSVK